MGCFSFVFPKSLSSTSKPDATKPPQGAVSSENVYQYSYGELKTATKGFSIANKIGEGGFGSVYRGTMKDGTFVAVKVLSAESSQGHNEFAAEIASMSFVNHENLVKLHGFCAQEEHRILVYDYMENNSLAQILHGKEQDRNKFSWSARSKVAFGVASGLAYLHEEMKPHIVHRDIKASNILLDCDLTPKISDFGLAKLFPDDITHLSTRVAGTIGYLAPEYALRGQVTRKSDVYSFGVLLMEIVSGRSVKDLASDLEHDLVKEAWELYKANELVQLVDTMLEADFPKEEAIRFLKVSLLCVQEIPTLRPTMPSAVMMMSNEIDIRHIQISQPGLINDFMKMKIGRRQTSKSIGSIASTSSASVSSMGLKWKRSSSSCN
ncbi:hypothetical protein AAC387_Pa01g4377 [Persea americana]